MTVAASLEDIFDRFRRTNNELNLAAAENGQLLLKSKIIGAARGHIENIPLNPQGSNAKTSRISGRQALQRIRLKFHAGKAVEG